MEPEKLEPAVEFLEDIKADEEVTIIHHWDMDGTSSSVLVSKVLEEVRGHGADEVRIPSQRVYHLPEEDMEDLKDSDVLIVLDFNLEPSDLEELQDDHGVDVLVVDHHSFERKPDVPFVNPREYDEEVYIPASKVCLDIAAEFGLRDELRWIAGLGVIQDFGVDSCPELFEELEKNYSQYLPSELTQEELAKNCEYGRYSSVLNIKPYRDSQHYAKLAYDALMESEDLKELEAQEPYRRVYEVYLEMQEEFNRLMENYEEEREIDREKCIIFFELDSEFHINSSIATNMSAKTPDWIHIVIQKDDEVNLSARCQSGRVDLGELLQQAIPEGAREEGAEAGGHRKAAGASLPVEYYDEFRENFTELV
ncbi:MAG: DHHA1 domain-containing protein [Candidatus Nanohaloarchaea archaeon]